MKGYDLAIIGAGPGGYVAALHAARAGARVCLIERDRVGGTCLNRGCIPTKALYASARTLRQLRHAGEHGIDSGALHFDLARAVARKDAIVATLVGGIEQLLRGGAVDLVRGEAHFAGDGELRVRIAGGQLRLRAGRTIIASGSRPAWPSIFPAAGKNLLTSQEILDMKELPPTLAVIGGGYIGCELAGIFAAFGVKVTIVEQLPLLLARSDRQTVREVERGFRDLGVDVKTGIAVETVIDRGDEVVLRLSDASELVVAKVLVAAGRVPSSDLPGLVETGVEIVGGAIKVDDGLRTSCPGVYAIGDVTGIMQLAHVASYQAAIAVTNALGGTASADYRVVPSAIFTFPEVAQVGLSEEECKERGLSYDVGRFAYQASGKALCEGEGRGSLKIMAARADGTILGASFVGAEASALIAEVALAMGTGLTAAQLGAVIHAHPTLPEMVMEAAEDVSGLALHRPARRGTTRRPPDK